MPRDAGSPVISCQAFEGRDARQLSLRQLLEPARDRAVAWVGQEIGSRAEVVSTAHVPEIER